MNLFLFLIVIGGCLNVNMPVHLKMYRVSNSPTQNLTCTLNISLARGVYENFKSILRDGFEKGRVYNALCETFCINLYKHE